MKHWINPEDKPKQKTRHMGRVPCKDADELARLHRIAKERGMTFSGMVRHDYLKAEVERVPTPFQDRVSEAFENLRDLKDYVINLPLDQQDPAVQKSIETAAKVLVEVFYNPEKLLNDRKVQPSPKRPKAGRVPDNPGRK